MRPPAGRLVESGIDSLGCGRQRGAGEALSIPVTNASRRNATRGEGRDELSVNREDPYLIAPDQEPNDSPAQARPFPATLTVSGSAGEYGDDDWYALPPLDSASSITATTTGVYSMGLSDGANNLTMNLQN